MNSDECVDTGLEIPFFREITGHTPYPWQRRLYKSFTESCAPAALNVPTGLGKTLAVLLFLLARAQDPTLPTRVIYIVDRRAIVDQTADAIRRWVDRIAELPDLAAIFDGCAAFPSDSPVQLGILRGGLADDGEWRVDPARPAVIIGTVDMIGSRIMFSGYGDGRSRRPMHAGLLGHDSIVMLDEAHLSPAMGTLLTAINNIQSHPKFQTMALSATSTSTDCVLQLGPEDEVDPLVKRRLNATKTPTFPEVEIPDNRIGKIAELATKHTHGAIAIFTTRVNDAEKVASKIARSLGGDGSERVALLTGRLRGKERASLASGKVWQRFLPDRDRDESEPSVFLVMTSAGEVGVDLDADHAVMDISTLDSMIQRLGRVNRAGLIKAKVDVVVTATEIKGPEEKATARRQKLEKARSKTIAVLKEIQGLSPDHLRKIDNETLKDCSVQTSAPAHLHREVVESFAATSASLQLPKVSVYLRGVSDDSDPPECFMAWRWDVAKLVELGSGAAGEAVTFFRPAPEEIARVPAKDAQDIIKAAFERREGGLPLIVIGADGKLRKSVIENDEQISDLNLNYATVLLPVDAGGLAANGLPSKSAKDIVPDVGDNENRIRYIDPQGDGDEASPTDSLPDWLDQAIEFRVPLHDLTDEDAEDRFLVYALRRPDATLQTGESDLTWLGASTQTVDEHCGLVGDAARQIGEALSLSDHEREALETAGCWHDRGKARKVWQRAAGAPSNGPPLAKAKSGRFRQALLGGYRHEFGSLAEAERTIGLDVAHRDLILHLIASHHGWARPGFPHPKQWDPDVPSAMNRCLARSAATRFSSLQAKYGPWRLAWLEALLKAADAYVSSRTQG